LSGIIDVVPGKEDVMSGRPIAGRLEK